MADRPWATASTSGSYFGGGDMSEHQQPNQALGANQDGTQVSDNEEVQWISREHEILHDVEDPSARRSRAKMVVVVFALLASFAAWDFYNRTNQPPPFTQAEEAEAIQAMMYVARSALESQRQDRPDTPDPTELVEFMGDGVALEETGDGGYVLTGTRSDGGTVASTAAGESAPDLETSFLLQPEVKN